MNLTKDRKIHGENNVWSTDQREKNSKAFMLKLVLNKTINQLTMTNSVCWYVDVLRREDGHVIRRTLDFEVEGHLKEGQRQH